MHTLYALNQQPYLFIAQMNDESVCSALATNIASNMHAILCIFPRSVFPYAIVPAFFLVRRYP